MKKEEVKVEETPVFIDAEVIADSAKEDIRETAVEYTSRFRGEVPRRAAEPAKKEYINCLRDTIITVKYLPQAGTISDPKHVLYGGLAERSTITVTVPRLRNNNFKNVLTDSEKDYLEMILGYEEGALSVYNRTNNFWDNSTEGGISSVRLTKEGLQLHLNDPIEFIMYKILLANTEIIAPDLYTWLNKPKATYRFVLIANDDVNNMAKMKMNTKAQCYVEYGKIESNSEVLRAVIEIITSKPLASNTDIDYLRTKAGELIDADAKLFLSVVKDPLLPTRILITKAVELGFISKKGDWYYLRSDNTPLCEGGEEPTLIMAAKYLNNPKRNTMKLSLETMIK